VLQPHNSNHANARPPSAVEKNPPSPLENLAAAASEPEEIVQHDDVATPKTLAAGTEDTPMVPLLPGGLTETVAPSPGQLQLLHPYIQPTPPSGTKTSGIVPGIIPPGFEIEIQAGGAPAVVVVGVHAHAPLFGAGSGSGSGDAVGNSGFDYFTATQISPAATPGGNKLDPSHAWAAGLPPAAAAGLQQHQQQLPLPLPPMRQPMLQQQQQQQQQPPNPPPPPSTVAPPNGAQQKPPQPLPPRRGGFRYNPEEAAARKAKLSALQEELKDILAGKGTEIEGGGPFGGAQLPVGFQAATGVLHNNNLNNGSKHPSPQASPALPTSPSTEIVSDDMADQLSALEAAAMAAKEEKEKLKKPSPTGSGGSGGGSGGCRERKRSRSPEADSAAVSGAPKACVGFTNGLGKAVMVDAKALAAAQRLLANSQSSSPSPPEKEDVDLGVPETEETEEPVMKEPVLPVSNIGATGSGGGGFSTGLGKKVEIPAEKLAAAKRLLEVDGDGDKDSGGSNATTTPVSSANTSARHNSTAAVVPGRRPSRLGPGGAATTAAAAAVGGVATKQQQQQRKGRGKFNTPRPAAPGTTPSTHQGYTTPGAATATTNLNKATPYAMTVSTTSHKSSTPLHDLKNSALKSTRAQFQGDISALYPLPGNYTTTTSTYATRWPDYLPLDSLTAAEYIFIEAGGRSLSWKVFHQRLLDAGANKQEATEEWVQNQYRWVVWKLARAEFATGPGAAGQILTSAVAEDELKLRYEREFNRGHRPLLKTVFHQDESAAAVAVYMVASVRTTNTNATTTENGGGGAGAAGRGATTSAAAAAVNTTMLELTDGWYWIMAQCDPVLVNLIQSGKISPGSKIRVMGAELLAPGGPGDPLTAARSARLRLHANGVHPVSVSTKLGRQSYRTTYLSLAAVHALGGAIPQTLLVVLRKYPRLLWTKLPSGVATFQTPRVQATADRLIQAERTKALATAAAQVQKQELARCKQWLQRGKSDGMMTQLDRWYATVVVGNGGSVLGGGGVTSSQGGGDFVNSLNTKDRAALERYTSLRRSELEAETQRVAEAALAAEVPASRNAGSTEAALLLVGEVTHECIGKGRDLALMRRVPCTALVTVWRPPEEFTSSIKEGEVFAVMGLEPSSSGNHTNNRITATAGAAGGSGGGAVQQQPPLLLPDSVLQLEAPPRSCHWRKIASSLARLPKQLAGQAMPRAVLTLDGMEAVAAAAASEGQQSATFDFTGVVLNAGPVYQNLNNAVYSHYQWIFFADASLAKHGGEAAVLEEGQVKEQQQWLLAVQLLGPQDAVSWLEPGEVGTVVSLHDLELSGRDEGSRMWRAAGGKHSAVVVHSSSSGGGGSGGRNALGRRTDAGVDAVISWARENPGAVKALQLRVEALLKG
jgi:hypothetical protein